jgi:hypothetical protein
MSSPNNGTHVFCTQLLYLRTVKSCNISLITFFRIWSVFISYAVRLSYIVASLMLLGQNILKHNTHKNVNIVIILGFEQNVCSCLSVLSCHQCRFGIMDEKGLTSWFIKSISLISPPEPILRSQKFFTCSGNSQPFVELERYLSYSRESPMGNVLKHTYPAYTFSYIS